MSAERFLDTNVFIYQLDVTDPHKSGIADALIRDAVVSGSGCISSQVVQECLNVMLRKARLTISVSDVRGYLESVLMPLVAVTPSKGLYHRALDIHDRYRFGLYDALIVAGALEAGCRELLSEDLQDGQKIDRLTIVNPFAAAK